MALAVGVSLDLEGVYERLNTVQKAMLLMPPFLDHELFCFDLNDNRVYIFLYFFKVFILDVLALER